MGLDGFSMSSMGLPKEITSAQAAANAEHLAQTAKDKIVGKIDKSVNKKINDEDKEEKQKQKFFEDGMQEDEDEDNNDDSSENEENNNNNSENGLKKYKLPIIKDPENITIRYNGHTDKVELYNKITQKTVETIQSEDFVDMISKLDYDSGVLVNKHI